MIRHTANLTVVRVLICLSIILVSNPVYALRNPAAVYCSALGYEYVTETKENSEIGFCKLPNGQLVDAWQFLQGKTGQKFSYCALKGYKARVVADKNVCMKFPTESCLVCVLPDGKEAEVTDLMGLTFSETTCGDGVCGYPENEKSCAQDCKREGHDQ